MRHLRMCLNWKVLAGLLAVGVGVWLVAPNLLAAAVPLLALAVCPLSMVLMMVMMSRGGRSPGEQQEGAPHEAANAEALQAKLQALEAEQASLRAELAAPEHEDGVRA